MPGADSRTPPRVVLMRNVFDNLGDAAMLECEIEALQRHLPEASLTVLTDDRRLAPRYPQVAWGEGDLVIGTPAPPRARTAVRRVLAGSGAGPWRRVTGRVWNALATPYRRRSVRRFTDAATRLTSAAGVSGLHGRTRHLLDTLRSASLVVGGGGLIGAVPAISEPRRALYAALRALGVPYVLHGVSFTDAWADDTYAGAALVVVRDRSHSRARAVASGVDDRVLVEAVDPAFALAPAGDRDVAETLASLGLERGTFLAVNVRAADRDSLAALLLRLSEILPEVARRLPVKKVLLFGMQRFRENHDGDVLARLAGSLAGRLPVALWAPEGNPGLLKGVLASARAIVSCRYHGAVFGLSSGVPTIGLVLSADYEVKLAGLFQWYGLDRLVLDVDRLCRAAATSWLTEIGNRDGELRLHLARLNQDLARLRERPYERMASLVA